MQKSESISELAAKIAEDIKDLLEGDRNIYWRYEDDVKKVVEFSVLKFFVDSN